MLTSMAIHVVRPNTSNMPAMPIASTEKYGDGNDAGATCSTVPVLHVIVTLTPFQALVFMERKEC